MEFHDPLGLGERATISPLKMVASYTSLIVQIPDFSWLKVSLLEKYLSWLNHQTSTIIYHH
jgi:hypothetical protein